MTIHYRRYYSIFRRLIRDLSNGLLHLFRFIFNRKVIITCLFLAIINGVLFVCLLLNDSFFLNKKITPENCNFLLLLSAIILSCLALWDDFAGSLNISVWKSILIKLSVIIFACDLAYIGSQKKDYLNNLEVQKERITADIRSKQWQRHFNDSLRVRSKEITDNFIHALAENGKEYSAQQKKVINLVRDSARRVINQTKIDPPTIFIDTIIIKDLPFNTKRVTFRIRNSGGEAKDIKFKIYLLAEKYGQYSPLNDSFSYFSIKSLNSTRLLSWDIDVISKNVYEKFYVYVNGSYVNATFNANYPYKELYFIDILTSRLRIVSGYSYDFIFEEFKKRYVDLRYTK